MPPKISTTTGDGVAKAGATATPKAGAVAAATGATPKSAAGASGARRSSGLGASQRGLAAENVEARPKPGAKPAGKSALDKLAADAAQKQATRKKPLSPRSKKREEEKKKLEKKMVEQERIDREKLELEKEELRKHEEKRLEFLDAIKNAAMEKRNAEDMMRMEREILRGRENEKKRLVKYDKEMESSWNSKAKLHYAALRGDQATATKLLAQDTEEEFNTNKTDPNVIWHGDGTCALHMAAMKGQCDMIRQLLEAGAQVDLRDNEGRTPLLAAAERGECGAIEALLEAGAELESPDRRGMTPLHCSVVNNRIEATRLLMARGASTSAVCTTQGHTLIHLAVMREEQIPKGLDMLFLLLGGHTFPLGDDVDEESPCMQGAGPVWDAFVEGHVSASTQAGEARTRLLKLQKEGYPESWLYDNPDNLMELVEGLCPRIPLPPYATDPGQVNVMKHVPMDTCTRGTAMHRALQAASILDNERMERDVEEEEKRTGKLRPLPTGEKQTARIRTRKMAIVVGNAVGPGGFRSGRGEDDARNVGRNLEELGFKVALLINASRDMILKEIAKAERRSKDGDLHLLYFSGNARCVGGRNYLLPSGGGADVFSTSQQVADGGINLHDDVIACLQRKQGTLTMVFLECFTCSPSISSPAGAGKWRTGESWGDSRFPKEFLAHIRPPGTPASEVVVLSNALQARTMDGPMHGLRGIVWPLIAGLPIKEESKLEHLLGEDGSLCLVMSHSPSLPLLPDPWALLSPFTEHLILNLWNEGGGKNGSGGAYIMMLSDTKSDVMRATEGRQNPYMYLSKDADKLFSFVPFKRKQVVAYKSGAMARKSKGPILPGQISRSKSTADVTVVTSPRTGTAAIGGGLADAEAPAVEPHPDQGIVMPPRAPSNTVSAVK